MTDDPQIDPQILAKAREQTKAVYERQAVGWDRHRPRVFYERPWLERFAAHLPECARVADLGCGAGDPIAAWFLDQGYQLTGVDFSEHMLDLCWARYPSGTWVLADMCDWQPEEPLNGLISWDGFFHLKKKEQRTFLHRLPDLLISGGVVLLTVGHLEGEVTGTVEGELVYHASLSPEDYQTILAEAGFKDIILELESEAVDGRSVLMAVRR